MYNHVPGDGREFVVAQDDTVKIRSEDGRSVVGLNISPFIRNLPKGRSTTCFSSADAVRCARALRLLSVSGLVGFSPCVTLAISSSVRFFLPPTPPPYVRI